MKPTARRALVTAGGLTALLGLGLLLRPARDGSIEQDPPATTPAPSSFASPAAAPAGSQGFLYGRITADAGVTYEGRLRWGSGSEEAFWGDYVNGAKKKNRWAASVPPGRLPMEHHRLTIFGFEIADLERPADLGRPFMARFGDVARIAPHGRDVQVTLKSGTVFDLDRFSAGDFDDTVRVWDVRRGIVDLESQRISSIELLPTAALGELPERPHGTVRTRHGDFTGFVQWDREKCVGTDMLDGETAAGEVSLRFGTIRAIARGSRDGSLVTLRDGREVALTGAGKPGGGSRGIYVDDPRYSRVLVSWEAFERLDLHPGDTGPGYDDFRPGSPLQGAVTTRSGDRLAGRLVFDLDESETTETLDAPSEGVDYAIPFGRIVAILPAPAASPGERARVSLDSGETLQLEPAGDLGERNAGILVLVDGRPAYVPWSDVQRVDLDRPPP